MFDSVLNAPMQLMPLCLYCSICICALECTLLHVSISNFYFERSFLFSQKARSWYIRLRLLLMCSLGITGQSSLICSQFTICLPLENRKPKVSWCFQRVGQKCYFGEKWIKTNAFRERTSENFLKFCGKRFQTSCSFT